MIWSDVFPILTDEIYDDYLAKATKAFRHEAAEWFAEQRTINPQEAGHIVSVSLFWKNIRSHQPDITIRDRADFMAAGRRRRILRFEPWSHYVLPVLEGAYQLYAKRTDVCFRVYLAADLEFLVPDLVEAGCEVRLMKSSSLRHNPGAMWRFLAFGEKEKLVTVVDADRARICELEIARTEAMAQSGLHWWRVPVWGELNEIGNVCYRPFLGLQMGSLGGLTEVRTMMEALVWASREGRIGTFAKLPGCPPKPVHGTVWPDYGFDEWFLLSAIYPRAAYDGMLTFIPSDAKSRLLSLDIQYVSTSNQMSELHYFGSPGSGCCAVAPGAAHASSSVRVRGETTVLVLGDADSGNRQKTTPQMSFEGEPPTLTINAEWMEALIQASTKVTTRWLAVVMAGKAVPGPRGAELFLGRQFEACDMAHSGEFFTMVTPELESWAEGQKLSFSHWSAGQPVKLPKLNGPVSLWSTSFLKKLLEEWEKTGGRIRLEIILRQWVEQGQAKTVSASSVTQGWVARSTDQIKFKTKPLVA